MPVRGCFMGNHELENAWKEPGRSVNSKSLAMNFESHIQGSKPVLVEFFAEWSQPSQLMASVLQEVKETAGERASVVRMDIDNEEPYAKDFHVFTVPTLMLFKEGRLVWRKEGISSSHEILEHLNLLME